MYYKMSLRLILLLNYFLVSNNLQAQIIQLSSENKALFEATAKKTYAALGYEIKDMEKFTLGYQFLMERPLTDEHIGRFLENLNLVANITKNTENNRKLLSGYIEVSKDFIFTQEEKDYLVKMSENNKDGVIFTSSSTVRLVNALKARGGSEQVIAEAAKIPESGIEYLPKADVVSEQSDHGYIMNMYVAASLKKIH